MFFKSVMQGISHHALLLLPLVLLSLLQLPLEFFAVSAVADSEDPLVFKSPMSFGSVLLALDLLTGKISGSTRAFSILCCAPGTRERLMPLPDLLLFASPEEV